MARKGISPLVAVIMLIAFTLIIAGILAGWATQFAETQSETLTVCLNSKIFLTRGVYNPDDSTLTIFVINQGKTDLTLTTTLTYSNETRHPGGVVILKDAFELKAGSETGKQFVINDVSDDLEKVEVRSSRCPGTLDSLLYFQMTGLGA